jgi:hypothetical protein
MAAKDTSVTTIDDEQPAVAAPRAKKIAVTDAHDAMSGEQVEVTIHSGEGEAGKQAVFLSINGHGILIPRGVASIVPAEVAEILDNATMTVYESGADGKVVSRDVKRFAYNVKSVK